MSIIASLAALSLAASSASAITLTPSCISTLTTTLTASPASECFATNQLLKFLPVALNGSQSIIPTVDNYLTALCPAPLCSNSTLESTVQSLVGGCGEIVASFGLKNETISKYTPFIPQIKNIGCLSTNNATEAYNYTAPAGDMLMNMTANATAPMAGNASVYCLPSILAAVEKISGKSLTFSTITSLLNKEMTLSSFINGSSLANSSELLCTDCVKGMIVQIETFSNGTQFRNATNNSTGGFIADVKKFVTGVCGEQFLNGSLPATVKDGANKNQTSTTTGATTGAAAASFSLNTGAVVAFAGVVGAMLI